MEQRGRKSFNFNSPLSASSMKKRASLSSGKGEKGPNEALIDLLLNDPHKRALVMQLLSQDKEKISNIIKSKEISSVTKVKKRVRCESPTAILRRRELQKRDQANNKNVSDSSSEASPSPIPFDKLLEGVVAYVEVKGKEGDRSAGAKSIMRSMGATVLDTFTRDVTHVVFKDGTFTTYQKAKLMQVHMVSVLWLEAVRRNGYKVPEKNYPALGTEAYDMNVSTICESMQMEYEEVVRDEIRRSVNMFSPGMSKVKPKKTALPTELKIHHEQFHSPVNTQNNSEDVVGPSQDYDAGSVISNLNSSNKSVNLFNNVRTRPPTLKLSNLERDSDTNSEVACVNGYSSRKLRATLNISSKNRTISESDVDADSDFASDKSNTSNENVLALISDKSKRNITKTINKKLKFSNFNEVDMELTNLEQQEHNMEPIQSASKQLHSSTRPALSCTEEFSPLVVSAGSDRLQETQKTENMSPLQISASQLTKKKDSVASDEMSSLRISTGSKKRNSNRRKSSTASTSKEASSSKRSSVNSKKTQDDSHESEEKSDQVIETGIKKTPIADSSKIEPTAVQKSLRSSSNINLGNVTNGKVTPILRRSRRTSQVNEGNKSANQIIEPESKGNKRSRSSANDTESDSTSSDSQGSSQMKRKTDNLITEFLNTLSADAEAKGFHIPENTIIKKRKARKLFTVDDIDESIFQKMEDVDSERSNRTIVKNETITNNKVIFKVPVIPLTPVLLTKTAAKLIKKGQKLIPSLPKLSSNQTNTQNSKAPRSNSRNNKKVGVEDKENNDEQNENNDNKVARRKSQRILLNQSCSSDNSVLPIQPIVRRSTIDFVNAADLKRKKPVRRIPRKSSIVCTRLHRLEIAGFGRIVKELGMFFVEDEVSNKTTHLVAGENKRTINLLRALARGCWILKHEWLLESAKQGKWLLEEDYEMTEFSPAVMASRQQRQAFGPSYTFDIFKDLGPIYVSRNIMPKCSDVQELVKLCKGSITSTIKNAAIAVGENVRNEETICVTPLWVLDSITANSKKPFDEYLIRRPGSPTV